MRNLPDLFRNGALGFARIPFRDFDRMLSDMWAGTAPGSGFEVPTLAGTPAFKPSCDVTENETHYLMSFDLPGVKKEDIKIDVQDGVLTVSGERHDENEKKARNTFHSERFYGSFSRSFHLPAGAKPEHIQASYADGVLKVSVPKAELAKGAQQVKIN